MDESIMMLTEKPGFKKWITLTSVLGFLSFILYLIFFTNFSEVGGVIGGTNVFVLILPFVCVLIGSAFDALAWKSALDGLAVETTFRKIFSLSWVGHFVDTIIPGGLVGDGFKTYLLTKEKDVNSSKAAASIVIKDVLELVVILGSLIIGFLLLVFNYSLDGVVMGALGVTILLMALPLFGILYLSINVSATEKLLRGLQKISAKIKGKESNSSAALQEKLHHQIMDFRDGVLSIKKNPKAVVKPMTYQTLAWVFEILALYFVFVAIGSAIGIDKVVITNTIVSNVQGQGVILAGLSQAVSSQLYSVLGITAGIAVTSSLLAGFASFWFKLVVSFGFFQVTVFERCVPIFCNKCIGWRAWRTKSCPEPKPKKPSRWRIGK
jgi:uncharacterized protein (TIRG00374 family)